MVVFDIETGPLDETTVLQFTKPLVEPPMPEPFDPKEPETHSIPIRVEFLRPLVKLIAPSIRLLTERERRAFIAIRRELNLHDCRTYELRVARRGGPR